MFVIVGIMTEAHSFSSQVGIGSESDCLLGLSNKILETSYSEVGLKTEKSGGATGSEGECGEVEDELLASERRSLDISCRRRRKQSDQQLKWLQMRKVKVKHICGLRVY